MHLVLEHGLHASSALDMECVRVQTQPWSECTPVLIYGHAVHVFIWVSSKTDLKLRV